MRIQRSSLQSLNNQLMADTFSLWTLQTHLPPTMSLPQQPLIEQLHNLEAKLPVRAQHTMDRFHANSE